MPTYYHEAIREEMVFHLSMKEGLSELEQSERWSKAAGAARGLRMANGLLNADPDDAKETLRSRWEEAVEAVEDDDAEPPIPCNDATMRKYLNQGYLFGIARAWAILEHESPHYGEKYGPNPQTTESFKYPRNQSTSERRHNVSTRA